jgi:hypothetical protein
VARSLGLAGGSSGDLAPGARSPGVAVFFPFFVDFLDPKVFSTNFSSNFFLVLDAKVFSSLKTFSFKYFLINFSFFTL